MLSKQIPIELMDLIINQLPAQKKVSFRGGRPRVAHEFVLNVIWFVLRTGCRWRDVPSELGCSGETARRRLLHWQRRGVWGRVHSQLLEALAAAKRLQQEDVVIDSTQVRSVGGSELSGPSPVDRAKLGLKHTLMVDRNGVPLVVQTTGSNQSDHTQIIPIVVSFPKIKGRRGRPRKLPKRLFADAGYDSEAARRLLRWLGVESHIRKRNLPHGSGLGKIRWVVERTISWVKGFRRMRTNFDRSKLAIKAWGTLTAAAICFRIAAA